MATRGMQRVEYAKLLVADNHLGKMRELHCGTPLWETVSYTIIIMISFCLFFFHHSSHS